MMKKVLLDLKKSIYLMIQKLIFFVLGLEISSVKVTDQNNQKIENVELCHIF